MGYYAQSVSELGIRHYRRLGMIYSVLELG
jgi:hypothetical protein